jgi:hypothetical protein
MSRWKLILRLDVFSLVFGSLLAVGLGFLALDKYLHNLLVAQITLGAVGLLLAAKFVEIGSSTKIDRRAKTQLNRAKASQTYLKFASTGRLSDDLVI